MEREHLAHHAQRQAKQQQQQRSLKLQTQHHMTVGEDGGFDGKFICSGQDGEKCVSCAQPADRRLSDVVFLNLEKLPPCFDLL